MENRKINILGTEYRIETHKVSEDSYLEKNKLAGYCGEDSKLIVIADMSEANVPIAEAGDKMAALGEEIGVEIRLQSEEIFSAMHRI